MFKLPISSFPRLTLLATATLLIQLLSVQAGTIPIVITENSASDFTATYNGSPLSPVHEENDAALFSLPAGLLIDDDISSLNGGNAGALVGFTEPDAPAQFNMLTTSEGENGTQLLFIHSDESVALFQKVHPSGVTLFPDGSSILIGI